MPYHNVNFGMFGMFLYINVFPVERGDRFAGTFAVAGIFGGVGHTKLCKVKKHTGIGKVRKA